VLLVCVLVGLAYGDLSISFQGNVSAAAQISNSGLSFRSTDFFVWNLGLWTGANFLSIGVTGSGGSATIDAVVGAVTFNIGSFPYSYVAYFSDSVGWDITGNWATSSVNSSEGFVASAFQRIIETDVNGNVVANQSLAYSDDVVAGFTWDGPDTATTNGELSWATYTGSQGSGSWTVSVSYVASDVVGVINQAGATVGPKSLESIVEISNWPYQSPNNTLSLVIAVASGSASISGNSFVSGSGNSAVYFTASSNALINAALTPVKVSAFVNGDFNTDINDSNLQAQLQGKYGAQINVKLVTVTFPAGAADIKYDPTVGSGQQVSSVPSSNFGVQVVAPVGFMAAAALFALFL